MAIKDVLYETEDKMKKTVQSVRREFAEVRAGRASPSLVEGILVDYYGTKTPIKQLATISTPDPRLIAIHPWDASVIKEVEKAIQQSNLGITPNNDGKIIRIAVLVACGWVIDEHAFQIDIALVRQGIYTG